MYKCDDCGEEFEYPLESFDDPSPPGVGLPPGHYVYYLCPYCESEDIYMMEEEDEDDV